MSALCVCIFAPKFHSANCPLASTQSVDAAPPSENVQQPVAWMVEYEALDGWCFNSIDRSHEEAAAELARILPRVKAGRIAPLYRSIQPSSERIEVLAKAWDMDAAQFREGTMGVTRDRIDREMAAGLCEMHARDLRTYLSSQGADE